MSPRQLNYFLRIAELGSFSRAAAVLYIAQPALSRQIKQLEDELGVRLLERSDTGVSLTEAGQLLCERAKPLLKQFDNVRNELGALSDSVKGRLELGMPPSLFHLVTVPLVVEYGRRYPNVSLSVTEGISSAIHHLVLKGEIDLGVVSGSEPMTGLERRPLLREQLFIAHQPGMAMQRADDGSVTLEEVARHPLVLTRSPNAMRVVLDEAMRDANQFPRVVMESNATRLLAKAAANGMGCIVNPYSGLYEEHRQGAIEVAPIAGLQIEWSLIYSRGRGLPLAGDKLWTMALSIAREHADAGRWLGASF